MFNYSKLCKYQKKQFGQILLAANTNFDGSMPKNQNVFEFIQNSSGGYLFNQFIKYKENEFIDNFHNILIHNILTLGDAISEGHYFVIQKDFDVTKNPLIRFFDKSTFYSINDQNELLINEHNFTQYKTRLEKFLILALNIDPFIRVDNNDCSINEFSFSFFENNLLTANSLSSDEFTLKTYNDFFHSNSFIDNLSLAEKFINTKYPKNAIENTKRQFSFEYALSDINLSISTLIAQQYQSTNNLYLLQPNISIDYSNPLLNIEENLIDDDKTNLSPYSNHSYITYNQLSTEHLAYLEKFTNDYQTNFFNSLDYNIKDIFITKFFNTYSKQHSNFTDKLSILSYGQPLIELQNIYLFLQSELPHLIEKYDNFVINMFNHPLDISIVLSYNEFEQNIFTSDVEVKLQQKIIDLIDSNISSSKSFKEYLRRENWDDSSFSKFKTVLQSIPDYIFKPLSIETIESDDSSSVSLSIPILSIIKENTFFSLIDFFNTLIYEKLEYNNNILSVSKDQKHLILTVDTDTTIEQATEILNSLLEFFKSTPDNTPKEFENLLNPLFRELVLANKLDQIKSETNNRKKLKI